MAEYAQIATGGADMPKPTANRLTKQGAARISRAARRRWNAYRRARKAGDTRLARKLRGR